MIGRVIKAAQKIWRDLKAKREKVAQVELVEELLRRYPGAGRR